jgi:hypothetical protein
VWAWVERSGPRPITLRPLLTGKDGEGLRIRAAVRWPSAPRARCCWRRDIRKKKGGPATPRRRVAGPGGQNKRPARWEALAGRRALPAPPRDHVLDGGIRDTRRPDCRPGPCCLPRAKSKAPVRRPMAMSCSAHCAVSFRRIHGRSRSHGHCRSNAGLAEIDQVTGVVVRVVETAGISSSTSTQRISMG